jgi:hypothetical protein
MLFGIVIDVIPYRKHSLANVVTVPSVGITQLLPVAIKVLVAVSIIQVPLV